MSQFDDLAKKVLSLLQGNNLDVTMFDEIGSETPDPAKARRFFVLNPNLMITIAENDDEEASNCIEFNKGKSADNTNESLINRLQKYIKNLASKNVPPINFTIKVFGKSIKPRDFAYQAKIKKDSVMENKSINTHILGKVLKELDYAAGMTAAALNANIPGSDLNHIQQALNKLVKDGKLETWKSPEGDIVYGKKMEEAVTNISESFSKMFGSKKLSQQTLENVRILIKHKVPVSEEIKGSRTRQIAAIFLECNGERFRFKENYLPGARAMAQHLAHGGSMNDRVGQYISESTSQVLKLQSFNRYVVSNKLINEDSSGIIETVKENIETLKTELRKLSGAKTYETIKARLETFERKPLSEDDVSQLKDLFTIRRFDEKIEEVLPIVKQLIQEKDTYYKRIEEAATSTIKLSRKEINNTPVLEFTSEHAKLGFKLSELSLRILENDELAGFINKIGTKICKEGKLNAFEHAIVSRVLENSRLEKQKDLNKTEIKESVYIENFFNRYENMFL